MTRLALVAFGGAAGSALRYLVASQVQVLARFTGLPYGTLAVNVLGCFAIGLLAQLGEARGVFTPEARLLVFTGVLGGFTTFSAFGNEAFDLLRGGSAPAGIAYVAAHLVLGLGAVAAGRGVGHWLWG